MPLLLATRRRFPLTPLAYRLLFVHALILMLGGHYTYAEVPLGFWVGKALGFSRNHYDRLGHFAQGFVPAILAREILLRRSPLRPGRWLFFLVACVCLAISATYELIEWWTALATGEGATAFLGTQGDPWDTQWDMFLALVGALSALALLGRAHDRAAGRAALGRDAVARLQDAEVVPDVAGHDEGQRADGHRLAVGVPDPRPPRGVEAAEHGEVRRPQPREVVRQLGERSARRRPTRRCSRSRRSRAARAWSPRLMQNAR